MGEGRVADIVGQRQSLGQVLIEPQHGGHGARDLRNLNGVRETVAEMIGKAGGEDLGLVFQPAKSPRMDDAVAVALEGIAVGVRQLGIAAAAGAFHRKTQMSERGRIHLPLNAVTWPCPEYSRRP